MLIWADQDRSEVKVIPRYLNWLTWFRVLALRPSGQAGIVGSLFLEKTKGPHLRRFRARKLATTHSDMALTSS